MVQSARNTQWCKHTILERCIQHITNKILSITDSHRGIGVRFQVAQAYAEYSRTCRVIFDTRCLSGTISSAIGVDNFTFECGFWCTHGRARSSRFNSQERQLDWSCLPFKDRRVNIVVMQRTVGDCGKRSRPGVSWWIRRLGGEQVRRGQKRPTTDQQTFLHTFVDGTSIDLYFAGWRLIGL